ncbi:MAG: endonuclease domain-containing protein [Chitinophagales bacterium]
MENNNFGWKTANPTFYQISRQYQLTLRKNQTPAEKVLWELVRNKQLGGFKFRRQHIIGVFIVDFVCIGAKLVIEVDGRIHDFQKEYDEARTKFLNVEGFEVIRFKNEEVLYDIEKVKLKIVELLEPLLIPSKEGEIDSNTV